MYAGASDPIGANYRCFLHSAKQNLMCNGDFSLTEEEEKAEQILWAKGFPAILPDAAQDFFLDEVANKVRRALELIGIENLKKQIGFTEEDE